MQDRRIRTTLTVVAIATLTAGCQMFGPTDDEPRTPLASELIIDEVIGPLPGCARKDAGVEPMTSDCRNAVASYLVAVADREFYAVAKTLHREGGTGVDALSADGISRVLDVAIEGATFWEVSKSFVGGSEDEQAAAEAKRRKSDNRQRSYSTWGLLLRGVRGVFGWGRDADSPADLIAKMELDRRAVLDKITANRSASLEDYPMTALLADIERYLYFGDVDVARGS